MVAKSSPPTSKRVLPAGTLSSSFLTPDTESEAILLHSLRSTQPNDAARHAKTNAKYQRKPPPER